MNRRHEAIVVLYEYKQSEYYPGPTVRSTALNVEYTSTLSEYRVMLLLGKIPD